MKFAGFVKVALIVTALAAAGCDSKKDQAGAGAAAPQGSAAPGAESQPAGAAVVVPEKDKSDARAQAAQLVAQLKAGDYQKIYDESAPGFKDIGAAPQFVAMMLQTRQKTGALQSSQEAGLETGADKRQMVTYSVQYENVKSILRLSFLRGKSGKMELVGLNQKDDLSQKQAAGVKQGEAAKKEPVKK